MPNPSSGQGAAEGADNSSTEFHQAAGSAVDSPTTIAADAVGAQPEGAQAESPTADGVKPSTPLEAVKAALKAAGNSDEQRNSEERKSPVREESAEKKEGEQQAADEISDEELGKHLSEKANRRFRQILAERDEVRQKAVQFEAEATAYRTVVERVRATGASAEQVDQAVSLLHAINNDPARAFEMLRPIYDNLAAFVGNKLPSDLQERVDAGFIDEESAAELARLRNVSKFSSDVSERNARAQQQEEQQRAINSQREAIGRATSEWESKWRSSDPDFQRKLPFVMSEIRAAIAEAGGVMSAEQALKIADDSLKAVNARLASILPEKREIKTVTGGFSSGKEMPRARSALEAATLALRQ